MKEVVVQDMTELELIIVITLQL